VSSRAFERPALEVPTSYYPTTLLDSDHFTNDMTFQKHYLEDSKSWELELVRRQHWKYGVDSDDDFRRTLKHHKRHKQRRTHHHHQEGKAVKQGLRDDDAVSEGGAGSIVPMNGTLPSLEIHQKDYDVEIMPPPESDTMHALMIDAGSQGTRIHIYEFKRRVLYTPEELTEALNGFKLSIPTTNTRWTNRLSPGLDALASYQDDVQLNQELTNYLGPLLEFARTVLNGLETDWYRYPIYLKATGGLRTLPTPDRIRLINAVRNLFQNHTFNPFEFTDVERARVISGEEEAMYGWAAVNFAIGTLVKDSEGKGDVLNPHRTWGMLEMGGASTQIAWFQNNGDIMANLMKLQIGGARHWNIYAHSFLYFGK
jgi:GDA1/CD39 (nucleoside phosphatase) family